jgi:cytochrome c553
MRFFRPPALALAAVLPILAAGASAQQMPMADQLQLCKSCHGDDGNSAMEKNPSLAGQPQFFLLNTLVLMREGVRPVPLMAPFVKDLSDDDIVALADHFAALPPKRAGAAPDPALVERGAALAVRLRCASCHGQDYGGQEQMPRLAGQRVDYLAYALKAYRDNTRKGADTLMSAAVFGVSDDDLRALAHFVSSR